MDFSIVLLHENMENKEGNTVTTSLTLLDIHDISRSSKTYGVTNLYIAHPSSSLRKLARALQSHWDEGYGATYNPNRKEALSLVRIVTDLDEAIHHIALRTGKLPKLIATSAKGGPGRMPFKEYRESLDKDPAPHLLMLGTGWGMSEPLLKRADLFLEPISGPTDYNHLSVRSACAIILDRVFGSRILDF